MSSLQVWSIPAVCFPHNPNIQFFPLSHWDDLLLFSSLDSTTPFVIHDFLGTCCLKSHEKSEYWKNHWSEKKHGRYVIQLYFVEDFDPVSPDFSISVHTISQCCVLDSFCITASHDQCNRILPYCRNQHSKTFFDYLPTFTYWLIVLSTHTIIIW